MRSYIFYCLVYINLVYTMKSRGQSSIEYLILVGFVTFFVIGLMAFSVKYTSSSRDKLLFTHVEQFAKEIISSAEGVFYEGEPSLATITPYLPENVDSLQLLVNDEGGVDKYYIVMDLSTQSGPAHIVYQSKVQLTGEISRTPGVKRLRVQARQNDVLITEG